MKKILFPLLVGFVCVVLTCFPLLRKDFFVPHDFTHAARIAEMNRSLLSGEFPVRWSANFGFGYGMPLFNFYAPLPYYLAQIPYLITGDAIVSIKVLLVFSSALSFFAMYILGKKLWGENGGLLSAVVYSFATYRALDIYVRGDIGELFAMGFLPLAIYGLLIISKNRWKGVLLASVSLAATLLSHNLSGMISLAILLSVGVVVSWMDKKRGTTLSVFGSLALGVALSAFYTLPAFFEKNLTRVEQTITTGYFDYHNHFVALRQFIFGKWGYGGSILGLEDGMSFALGWIPITLLSLSIVFVVLYRKKVASSSMQLGILLFFLFAGSLFMASNRSTVIWDQVGLLKFMQFPWRFLEFSHLFLAVLCGAVGLGFEKKKSAFVTFLFGVLVLFSFTQISYFSPEKFVEGDKLLSYYSTDPAFIRETMSKTLNDYLPPAIHDDAFPTPINERIHMENGDGNLKILKDTPTKIMGEIACGDSCAFNINIFEFPQWTLTLNGDPVVLPGGNPFPISSFSVPSGNYRFSVQLEDTPIRKVGNVTSLLGVAVTAILIFRIYDRRTHRSR